MRCLPNSSAGIGRRPQHVLRKSFIVACGGVVVPEVPGGRAAPERVFVIDEAGSRVPGLRAAPVLMMAVARETGAVGGFARERAPGCGEADGMSTMCPRLRNRVKSRFLRRANLSQTALSRPTT